MFEFNKYFVLLFEGACAFMAIFFFIQYAVLRKKEYFFYGMYLLVLTLYYLTALPDFFFRLTPNDQEALYRYNMFKRPLQFMSSLFYTIFVIYYLRLKKTAPRLHKFLLALLVFYVVCALLCLAGNFFRVNYESAYILVSMLFFPIQLITVFGLFKANMKYGYYVIFGSLLLVVGSAITLNLSLYLAKQNLGFYTLTDYSYVPVQFSILFDIFLFSIALQRKVADNEKYLLQAAIQRQEAIHLERERIIIDLHDDVGGGLSSIRMISDLMAQDQSGDTKRSAAFAQKISATAKDIAQRMNTIIWSLNAENDTVQNFAEYVRQYGVAFFEDSATKFEYDIDGDIPQQIALTGIQRKNLFLVAKEAFHNILKHAGASKASVAIGMQQGRLCLSIHDNGQGIKDKNQFGNGLKNMQKRIDEIGGTIRFDDNGGTSVAVCLPMASKPVKTRNLPG